MFQIVPMAPVFYCSCTNCNCTATVLFTQTIDKKKEENTRVVEQVMLKTNTTTCDDILRKREYVVPYLDQEPQSLQSVETFVLFAGGALLLVGNLFRCGGVIRKWGTFVQCSQFDFGNHRGVSVFNL